MANEPIQGGPYPEPIDPPDGPGQMSAIVGWAAGRSVMRFASLAARDAALPTPVDGMVCYVAADNGYYARVGGRWELVWRAAAWVPVPLRAGFTAAEPLQALWTPSGIHTRGRVSGTFTTGNVIIGDLPEGYRPVDRPHRQPLTTATTAAVVASCAISVGGEINISVATAGSATVNVMAFWPHRSVD